MKLGPPSCKFGFTLATILCLSLFTSWARAGSLVVVNPGFETGNLTGWSSISSGGYGSGTGVINNTSNQSAQYPNFGPTLPGTASGTYYASICGYDGNPATVLYQDISANGQGNGTLQPNTAYTLTAAIGEGLYSFPNNGYIELVNGTTPSGTVLATANVSTLGYGYYANNFKDLTVTFTTGSSVSGDLTVAIGTVHGFSSSTAMFLDNVRLTAVPVVLMTSDPLLNTGKPGSINYTAPGTSSAITQIASSAKPSNLLWNLVPDAYDLTSGSGTINIAYSGQGAIKSTVNLTGLNAGTVDAYPFIGYGADVFGYKINGQPPQFPAKLSSMTSLVFDTTFALAGTFTGNIDILFDEWLMPTATYSGGASGAVEVEILPYFSFTNGRYGTFIKTFTVPVTLNGTATTLNFAEYASAVGKGGGSLILFYPNQGFMSGAVRFDALLFMNEAATTAAVNSTWYVAGFQLGTEFGQSATENYTFTVNKISIEQTLSSH